jgi:hypothetical protein
LGVHSLYQIDLSRSLINECAGRSCWRPSGLQVYRQHALPLLSLPSSSLSAGARRRLVLRMLRDLPAVLPEDPGLAALLAALPLVPNGAGVVRRAGELYDPRVQVRG